MKGAAKWSAAALLGALLVLQSPALPADPVAAAKTYYDAGVRAYAAAQYLVAIEAFNEAYRLSPRESVLFSLAQAERRQYTVEHNAKHLRDAIARFRRYLTVVTEGGRRGDAVEALGELEAIAVRLSPPGTEAAAVPPVVAVPDGPSPARVMVSVLTKDATIALDGKEHKDATIIEEVTPGPHTVRVTAAGYVDEQREIRGVPGTLVPLEITLREQPSYLQLAAPAGARVLLDGQPLGEAPLPRDVEVVSGSHLLTVTRTGYVPYHQPVSVERGQIAPIAIDLSRTRQRFVSFGVFGASAAALLGGGGLAIASAQVEAEGQRILSTAASTNLTRTQLADYNAALALRDDLRRASLATFAVAGGLALTAVALYAFDNPVPASSGPAGQTRRLPAKVSFTVSPGAASIALTGTF